MSDTPHKRRSAWPLVAGFAVLAVLIAAAGYWAWHQQAQSMRHQAERSLVAVGDLKASQIAQWLGERLGDAQIIRADPLVSAATADLLAGRGAAQASADLQAILDAYRRTYGYAEVVMTSPEGAVLLSSPRAATTPLGARTTLLVRKSAATGLVQSSDLFADATGQPRIDFVAPVLGADRGVPALAAVSLRADPADFLYPLIQTWPLPSPSGETLLVERRGDQVVYLNDLRFREDAALVVTAPVDAPGLPAAMAVRGQRGVVRGVDYRGVPVMAAVQPVPETPWFIVAKENSADVLGPIRTRGWITAAVALVLVALAGLGTLLLWRARDAQASAEIRENEEKFRTLFENMTEGVALHELVVDAQGAPLDYRILDLNPAYENHTGVSADQVRGKLSGDAYGTAEPPYLAEYARTAQTGEPLSFQVYFEPLAKHFDIAVVAQGEGRFATVFEDITERKRVHEALLVKNSAFDESIAASSIADLDGLIVEANATFLRFWGYPSRDEIVGKPIASFLADQAEAVAIVTALNEAGQWEGEYVAKRRDGSHFIAHGMATVVRDANGAVSGYQSAVLDFTARKQMEKALQESQLLLTQAEKLGRVGGWEFDIDTQVQTWTDTVYDIHELDTSGRPTVDQGENYYTPASRPIIERAVKRAIEQGEPFDVELEIITAKGNLRSVHAIGQADLARRKVSGFFQDITERKQAEDALRASEERYRTMFNSMMEGFCIIEVLFDEQDRPNDYRFLEINSAFEAQTGLRDAQGKRMRELAPKHEAHWFELYGKVAVTGEPAQFENEAKALHRWFAVNAYRVGGQDSRKVGILFNDITENKQAEDEIRLLNAELEQRVLDRTAQFDAANKELEAFAYSVSHDLRAPLRHISGFSALLAERVGDRLDEKSSHYVDTISTSVREMGVLIDDLLQFSRTGRAELSIGAVDMDATLAEALEPLRRETEGRAIEWSIEPLPAVVGDHALLRQVWANLLGNAAKYSRGKEPARIEVGAREGGEVNEDVFWVRDNGVGFDMQYVHKLFGVFQRLHSSAEFEGTGIGLANVQRIINRLGGRVWAEGEVDHGATFYFSLPRRKETPS